MNEQPLHFERAAQQPESVEIKMADGIFVKSYLIHRAGTFIPQHAHKHEHLTMLAAGSIAAWKDGHYLGTFTAPAGIVIEANSKHTFEALVDNCLLYCIHNISRTGDAEIAEEHQLVGQQDG